MPANPWTDAAEIAKSPFGVTSVKDGVSAPPEVPVLNTLIQFWRGNGIITGNDGRIAGITSRGNYTGARLGKSDSRIGDATLYNNRDVGLWIAKDAGNCQSNHVHCYGARIACYNEGGENYRSTGDTFADSLVGFLGDGESILSNVDFQHNPVRDAVLRGGDCQLNGCNVFAQLEVIEQNQFSIPGLPAFAGKAAVELVGGGSRIVGGAVWLTTWSHPLHHPTGNPATAVVVTGSDCQIKTNIYDADGLDGSRCIVIGQKVTGLRVKSTIRGFMGPSDQLFTIPAGVSCKGMDVTLRISGSSIPLHRYIPEGDWTGSFKIVDKLRGAKAEARQ